MSDFKDQAAIVMRLLYNVAQKKGITQNQIAVMTGLKQSNVSRMFGGQYPPKLHHLLKVADAIGVFITFQDRDESTDMAEALRKAIDGGE